MLIIEQAAMPNGAHRNQTGTFREIPEGWLPVLPSIETEALEYLPFINLDTIERGWIVAVSQGTIPEPEPEPEPEPSVEEHVTNLETAIANGLNLYEGDLGNA